MAGAGLFVCSRIGTTHLSSIPWAKNHVLVKAWCVAVFIHAGLRGCFLAGSTNLEQGVGLAQQNIQRLAKLGDALRFYRVPYVVGGDWNVSPDTLSSSEFVSK
eukprot:2283073-Pyramimonas_sp.AAC.1